MITPVNKSTHRLRDSGIITDKAPRVKPVRRHAIIVPPRKEQVRKKTCFPSLFPMAKGAIISHEWPQGLIPCISPRIRLLCAEIKKTES
jgi:hypothetical protein